MQRYEFQELLGIRFIGLCCPRRHSSHAAICVSRGSAVHVCMTLLLAETQQPCSEMHFKSKCSSSLDGLVERKKHIKYVSLCLSVLTDFCIHYSSCVHYILKADLNMNVLKFVVDNLLPLHSSAVQKNNSSGLNAKNDGSNPSVVALSLVTFSLMSRIILFAVLGPIPGIKLNDFTSSAIIFSLKFATEIFDSKLIAVLGPIPDTPIN